MKNNYFRGEFVHYKNHAVMLFFLWLISLTSFSADLSKPYHLEPNLFSQELGGSEHLIHDFSHIIKSWPATSTPGLLCVEINRILKQGSVFLGFGLPNVFIGMVTEKGQLNVAAKSLYRGPTQIHESDGRVQSGIFLVPKKLPPALVNKIQEIALARKGNKNATCVHENVTILSQAGLKLGNKEALDNYYLPHVLLHDILKHGLGFSSDDSFKKIDFDIVKTTARSLGQFYGDIESAVLKTPLRHLKRLLPEASGPEERRHKAAFIKDRNNARLKKAKPSGSGDEEAGNSFEVLASQASAMGKFFRHFWGAHTLFKLPISSEVKEYLPEVLKAFDSENLSLVSRAKKHFFFSTAVVNNIHQHMAPKFLPLSKDNLTEKEILALFKVHTNDDPNRYNFVVTGQEIIIARLNVNASRWADWALGKHVLLANYSNDVRFAGELYKDGSGKLHINNNSGTYRPSAEQLKQLEKFLKSIFAVMEVEVENI